MLVQLTVCCKETFTEDDFVEQEVGLRLVPDVGVLEDERNMSNSSTARVICSPTLMNIWYMALGSYTCRIPPCRQVRNVLMCLEQNAHQGNRLSWKMFHLQDPAPVRTDCSRRLAEPTFICEFLVERPRPRIEQLGQIPCIQLLSLQSQVTTKSERTNQEILRRRGRELPERIIQEPADDLPHRVCRSTHKHRFDRMRTGDLERVI